jgi:hypothetical protein
VKIKSGPVTEPRRPKPARLQTFILGPVGLNAEATCQAVTEPTKAAKIAELH